MLPISALSLSAISASGVKPGVLASGAAAGLGRSAALRFADGDRLCRLRQHCDAQRGHDDQGGQQLSRQAQDRHP